MSARRRDWLETSRLRAEFDAAFASPPPEPAPPMLDLLLVRVAEQLVALRLDELLAVYVDRRIVAAPSLRFGLLGVVGLKGVVAAAYDLRVLLGHAAASAPRWLAQLRGQGAPALAFDRLEQHVRVPSAALVEHRDLARGRVGQAVQTDAGTVTLVDLSLIRAQVAAQSPRAAAPAAQEMP